MRPHGTGWSLQVPLGISGAADEFGFEEGTEEAGTSRVYSPRIFEDRSARHSNAKNQNSRTFIVL